MRGSRWDQVHADLKTAIDMFSQDEHTFVRFKGSWEIGQIIRHLGDCEIYWLHFVDRYEIKTWKYYDLAVHPTQTAIKDVLERVRMKTISFLESLDQRDLDVEYTTPHDEVFSLRWIIWHGLGHEIYHGESSLTIGILERHGLDV